MLNASENRFRGPAHSLSGDRREDMSSRSGAAQSQSLARLQFPFSATKKIFFIITLLGVVSIYVGKLGVSGSLQSDTLSKVALGVSGAAFIGSSLPFAVAPHPHLQDNDQNVVEAYECKHQKKNVVNKQIAYFSLMVHAMTITLAIFAIQGQLPSQTLAWTMIGSNLAVSLFSLFHVFGACCGGCHRGYQIGLRVAQDQAQAVDAAHLQAALGASAAHF